jgi:hypothetical protein
MIVIVVGDARTEIRDAILLLLPMLETEERAPRAPAVQRVVFTDGPTCVICLEPHGRTAVAARCGHCYHLGCIERWAEQSSMCPVCRADICD